MLLLLVAALLCTAAEPPPVLLIGIDGLRHDEIDTINPPNMKRLRTEGSYAKALIPCFPTLTFPNFYAMATGLRPERHGIVGMDFYDPVRGQRFSYRDREAVGDGTWYGGTPIWTLAERAGIRTAAYFWVGTEAEIGGKRPTWWHLYDDKITHQQRVDQVVEWLAMPAGRRPRLVLLYFADVDTAAHRHGPGSAEASEALLRVDASIGQLLRRIRLPMNVILVSDHGLLKVDDAVRVEDFADLSGFTVTRSSNLIGLYSRDGALIQRTHQKLKGASKAFEVYRRGELPEHLHFRDHVRIPDLMIMSTGKQKLSNSTAPGAHGWDPRAFPEMRGTFLGAGPSIRKGVTLEPVENIHVFPLLAHLLGLPIPKGIDGSVEPMRAILRH